MRTRVSRFLPFLCASVLAACGVDDTQRALQQEARTPSCEFPYPGGSCDLCGDGYCAPSEVDTCSADCYTAAYCGDGACNGSESCSSCVQDCGPCNVCGDGVCGGSESCSSCAQDCGPCNVCGDGICDGSESCSSCAQDCGTCSVCGDGICNGAETCKRCAQDCGVCVVCGDGICNGPETCSSCAQDCGACPVCGDGTCNGAETCSSCAGDCGVCPVCGDGICNNSETCSSCPGDCPPIVTAGNQIATGAIPVTSPNGALITGLVPGNWYSVETAGGPWFAFGGGTGPAFYGAWVSNDNGTTWFRLNQGIDNNDFTNAWGFSAETFNTNYQRGYWRATTASIRIRVADNIFDDNSGTLTWVLRNASSCCTSAYTAGGQIASGSIPVTSASGAAITGLVPGSWYSVETTGGPWYAFAGNAGPAFYGAAVSNDNGTTWRLLDQGSDNRYFTNTWGAWVEPVGTNYRRGYWRATTTSIRIQVPDSVHSDNTGSLSWILRNTAFCGP